MIEKLYLDRRHSFGTLDWLENRNEPSGAKLIETKINELVDAVNELQESQNTYWTDIAELKKELQTRAKIVQGFKNLQDPYAEQRKCICKLCWFWNDDKADKVIGILTGVFDEAERPFERNICQRLYKHCEPVLPTDNAIYKGDDNE